MKFKIIFLTVLLSLTTVIAGNCQLRLSPVFGTDMVLQREAPIEVYGIAPKNQKVTVLFGGQKASAKAGADGRWAVTLEPMPAGGPYVMKVRSKSGTISFDNVMVGEVWLCSGQSNMEWKVDSSADAAAEVASADYPMIRCLTVAKSMAVEPRDEFTGSWAVCSPETVGDFSAVGYFFARELWRELGVPVGIINSSWGGTDVEVWTSPDSYAALPASVRRSYDPAAREAVNSVFSPEAKVARERFAADLANDPGLTAEWYDPAAGVSGWKVMTLPQEWTGTPLAQDDGHVWFRREFDLPASAEGMAGVVSLGPIDDNDITWINGVEVGSTNIHNIPRVYEIEKGVLHGGRNTIVVRVTDTGGNGGLYGTPDQLWITARDTSYPIDGDWLYKGSVITSFYRIPGVNVSPNSYNSTLYNAMINPLVGFRIKGAIWYQGENNAWNARSYRTLFPNMIVDWREKWGYDFPFYWVQLANFRAESGVPSESSWAELREAQTMTLALPQTGQAVIIDIGEAGDIHPRNKQDVGRRLALNALAKDYGCENIIYSGPMYTGYETDGNKVVVTFETYGSELAVRGNGGQVEGFAVAGPDRVFHWARAWIEDGKIVVVSDEVANPVAVRYAWDDNPRTNLFNSEGLPASPFRTDEWPGITN